VAKPVEDADPAVELLLVEEVEHMVDDAPDRDPAAVGAQDAGIYVPWHPEP
jgi:hypothetical protein